MTVVVAAHDLTAGQSLTTADLHVREVSAEFGVNALSNSAIVIGRSVTGPIRQGEVLTETRLLSPRLPAELKSDRNARLVAVQVADRTTATLMRVGDVVDVLRAPTEPPDPTTSTVILARNAVVAVASQDTSPSHQNSTTPSTVLLAMGEHEAHVVASAGLAAELTVVLH